jgi:ribosome biogenesis GTPase
MIEERGVVLSGTGGVWQVRTTEGATREASLRGRLKQEDAGILKLAVGDAVRLAPDERGGDGWTIVEILPRRSTLVRREPGGGPRERVVVSNVDQVVVAFAAADPAPHLRALDRFLVVAEANALAARIVVNKIDRVDPAAVRAQFADYPRAGYPMHFTSVRTGEGLSEIRAALTGRTSAIAGPSGVGKSSLLNALYPGLNLRVGAVSEAVHKGRHTTVGALLHPLPDGGYVVDTPGLREVGVWGISARELAPCFPEFRPYVAQCRFADCTHRMEPECAVRAAVSSRAISRARYESYAKLFAELETSD